MTTIEINNNTINTINATGGDLSDFSQEKVTVYTKPMANGQVDWARCRVDAVYQGIVCEYGDIVEGVLAALTVDHPGCFFVVGDDTRA